MTKLYISTVVRGLTQAEVESAIAQITPLGVMVAIARPDMETGTMTLNLLTRYPCQPGQQPFALTDAEEAIMGIVEFSHG